MINWVEITSGALLSAWTTFISFLPQLVGAIIVFVVGWLIAIGIGRLVAEVLARIGLNKLFERSGWKDALEKADLKVGPSLFIGAICKWIVVVVFLLAAVEILGFVQFAAFLNSIISWIPNLIVAIAIFIVSIIVADILEKIILASVRRMEIGYAEFSGALVRWAIYVFAGLAILLQLGVTPTIINTLIVGFVGMIALAAGLAFGLGGKDFASKVLEDLGKKLSK